MLLVGMYSQGMISNWLEELQIWLSKIVSNWYLSFWWLQFLKTKQKIKNNPIAGHFVLKKMISSHIKAQNSL